MEVSAGARAQHAEGYRHEARFYAGGREFVGATLPFIREAVAAEEPILVVVSAPKIDALRASLNGESERVTFADMDEVGANPARIIPAWQRFIDEHAARGRPLRGIGEPICAARSPAELAECQRHEALLNVAFEDPALWLLCPYDTEALGPEVIEKARRHHPFVSDRTRSEPSPSFPGADELARPFDEPLPPQPADAAVWAVHDPGELRELRSFVGRQAIEAGLTGLETSDLVLAVMELASNSLRHGGGRGSVAIWREHGSIVCEVRDGGRIEDPLVGRVQPSTQHVGGRGLWLVNQLCELVQIRSFPSGTVVRAHKRVG